MMQKTRTPKISREYFIIVGEQPNVNRIQSGSLKVEMQSRCLKYISQSHQQKNLARTIQTRNYFQPRGCVGDPFFVTGSEDCPGSE